MCGFDEFDLILFISTRVVVVGIMLVRRDADSDCVVS